MVILTAEQIRAWDTFTIENKPIPSIDLMENASLQFTDWFTKQFDASQKVKIFCGLGNNGGDGLAIARLLSERSYSSVEVYAVRFVDKSSKDFEENEKRLEEVLPVHNIEKEDDFPKISRSDVVIDAIFGSGLSRLVTGFTKELIRYINRSEATIVSVDIASGLFADKDTVEEEGIITPDYTYTFQVPKLAFMLPQNEEFTGEVVIGDIGLKKEYLTTIPSRYHYVDKAFIGSILKKRRKFSHKGTYGHALLIGGRKGQIGAVQLAAKAVLRAGVGLLTVYTPHCGYAIVQSTVPEAMCVSDMDYEIISEAPEGVSRYDSVGIGPGLGQRIDTQKAMVDIFNHYDHPMVLDADALNILAKRPGLLSKVPENSILTPHPKEFDRLLGEHTYTSHFDRLRLQVEFAQRYHLVVVLKGAHTSIATPIGNIYFNSTGNAGMATGGSGDALTGIITSLLAQGYAPGDAAILGVYLHGHSGDLAAQELGQEALIASDIINYLGKAYLSLSNDRKS